jgi:hypothetical protein
MDDLYKVMERTAQRLEVAGVAYWEYMTAKVCGYLAKRPDPGEDEEDEEEPEPEPTKDEPA